MAEQPDQRAVVVGYDGSEGSRTALEAAIEVARLFGDRLVVAYASQPPDRRVGEEYSEHQRAIEELGRVACDEAIVLAAKADIAAEAVLVPLRPAEALVELARERNARVIVVGTYGESPLRGAILGSTPHKLLHLVDRPLLVVPAGR